MTHLGCFYFLLFLLLLLGFISNSQRSEPTKSNADRTLIELNSILSMIRLAFVAFVHLVLPFLKLAKYWTVGPR